MTERVEQGNGELVAWGEKDPTQVFTFIDTATMKGKALAAKAFSTPDLTKKEMEQEVFTLTNFLVHDAFMKDDKTGEKNLITRIVLYDKDGQTAAFASEGIVGTVKKFISLFGPPPWNPALPVKLKESNTRLGYRVYSLEILPEMIDE